MFSVIPPLICLLLLTLPVRLFLIKLQMDPTESGASLQKTSPKPDPAAVMQLSTELSAQASQLTLHHHQLNHLTTLTEELVKDLQGLRGLAANAPSVQSQEVSPPTVSTPVNPRLAFPEKFDGTSTKCKGFLLQCTLFVDQQPSLYSKDSSRIAFVCSLLTGRALEWATAVWGPDGSSFTSFRAFLRQFRSVFEHPTERGSAGEQLLNLSQGRRTTAEYALSCTLAAQTNWVEDTLKTIFRKGLTVVLQSELACRDEGKNLNQYIDLAIQVDNLIRSRRSTRTSHRSFQESTFDHEPMQVGFTHLTPEERERRMQNHLCLYCGQSGHMKSSCPVRPLSKSPPVSSNVKTHTTVSSLTLPVRLLVQGNSISTTALIDSGAAGNFISHKFAVQCKLQLNPCHTSLRVEALDG